MPDVGGTALAEKRPMTLVRMSRVIGSFAKPAARARTAKRKSEPRNSVFRPNKSAIRPKKSRKAPLLKLDADVI